MLKILYGVGSLVLFFSCAYVVLHRASAPGTARPYISQVSQIHDLFPSSAEGINTLITSIMERTQKILNQIYLLKQSERTFANTIIPFDEAIEDLTIGEASLEVLSLGSPDENVRMTASEGLSRLKSYAVDAFSLNEKLYKAFVEYEKELETHKHEMLSPEQQYFLQESLKSFKRDGLQLPKEEQDRVRSLKKELAQINIEFDTNIASSRGFIAVQKDDLKGLDESFIDALEKNESGDYMLSTNQALVSRVLEKCQVASTRKAIYHAYMQRAYPENEKVLERIRAVTHELAKTLGYESYAHYMLGTNMAKSPQRVIEFLTLLFERSNKQARNEIAAFLKEQPPSVVLEKGKIKPWDISFVYDFYKQKHFDIDEAKLSEYFPLEYTLPALLRVYEDFFGVRFNKIARVYLWHEDLRAYAVYKKGQYLGTIILDLFPRPHKYTHAGFVPVVPALKGAGDRIIPGVGVLFLNFTPPQADQPTLLKRSEVVTFFHEFGHALHSLLGATELASTAGTSTKLDFVEMPSQMLEEWLWEGEILKAVSSHIKTKEPLPDEMIERIIMSKRVGVADGLLRQIYYAQFSLAFYLDGSKSAGELWRFLGEQTRSYIVVDPLNKGYCSFVHLSGYGPGYYGYLWAKVFAMDLFAAIKPHGLRNGKIGEKYVKEVLNKGGSLDPDILLNLFLGRNPSTDAFFKDLGLD